MPPDSPNPSPTQEVERFDVQIAGATDEGFLPMDRTVDGGWVRFEDYQAEVEKREEAETTAGVEIGKRQGLQYELEAAKAEIERRARGDIHPLVAQGLRCALQLLRDKGTEQGGGDG